MADWPADYRRKGQRLRRGGREAGANVDLFLQERLSAAWLDVVLNCKHRLLPPRTLFVHVHFLMLLYTCCTDGDLKCCQCYAECGAAGGGRRGDGRGHADGSVSRYLGINVHVSGPALFLARL